MNKVETIISGLDPHFRWRGGEKTRMEGFSDGVFAFALTLLVVSLEVPETYRELLSIMQGFLSFMLSFAILALIWYTHFIYFRRFGVINNLSVFLNLILLFLSLLYVYPLKFMSTFLMHLVFGFPEGTVITDVVTLADGPGMMIIYSSGYASVFLVFFLLYLHAWKNRERLQLNKKESYTVQEEMQIMLVQVVFGLLSVLISLFGGPFGFAIAGWVYFLLPVALFTMIFLKRKKKQAVFSDE